MKKPKWSVIVKSQGRSEKSATRKAFTFHKLFRRQSRMISKSELTTCTNSKSREFHDLTAELKLSTANIENSIFTALESTYTFDDYVNVFEDAISVFGRQGVGSRLLAGIEPSHETLYGLDTIAQLGVVPSPTVLTPFVMKQKEIPFVYDLDELIDVHAGFNDIIKKYDLPVFSGVFSLA